jgi:hypothetical protein
MVLNSFILVGKFVSTRLFLIYFCISSIQANLQHIVYPAEFNQTADANKHAYEFTPIATIIGFVFIGISFSFLAIAKVLCASSDQYMMKNQFDLVIFKPPTNKSVLGPRRVYSNTVANAHNLTAANAVGFNPSVLNGRNPYTLLSSAQNASGLGCVKKEPRTEN